MECIECAGALELGRTTEFYTVAEHLYLVVEAVPAQICRQCTAAYTDRETTEVLMRLVQKIRDSVPIGGRATIIYDFPTIEQLAKTA